MKHRTPASPTRTVALIGALAAATPFAALAQQGTPVVSTEGITLAASGLEHPRGFTWGTDGTLYVALAGTGGERTSSGASRQEQAIGPFMGGRSGSVAWIDDGCPVTFEDDLPSSRASDGAPRGPAAVALLDGRIYVLEAGGGEAHANPETPNGVYAVDGDGSAELIADLSAWIRANPVAALPGDHNPDGEPFAMIAGDDELWVAESNSGQLLRVTPNGTITRTADLSAGQAVPTGLALAADGGLYVGFLTAAPYADGAAKVVEITPDGTVSDAWTGLTAVTALAVAPDGTLYALEMGTGNTPAPPFAAAATGKVVRQAGPAEAVDVAVGLDLPVAMAFGPDEGLYVGFPAVGPDGATGALIRLDLDQGQTMTMSDELLAGSTCPGAVATPEPAPAASPAALGTPVSGDDAASGGTAGGAPAVTIANFAFGPTALQVAAGTTVTWTNNDSAAHTVTADDGSFDSGNLAPGQSFTFTFDQSGSFTYHCSYHPNMVASIVVQ